MGTQYTVLKVTSALLKTVVSLVAVTYKALLMLMTLSRFLTKKEVLLSTLCMLTVFKTYTLTT